MGSRAGLAHVRKLAQRRGFQRTPVFSQAYALLSGDRNV